MNLVLLASERLGIHPATIFMVSLHYNEIRMNKHRARKLYDMYLRKGDFPDFTKDFALELLAGNVRILKRNYL